MDYHMPYCFIENGMYIIAVALILFGNPNLCNSLIPFWEILKAGSQKLLQCAVVCTLYEILWKKHKCMGLWLYWEGVGGGEDRILVFWWPGERGTLLCHFASSSEFKMIPMLLIVNTLFAHSKDTVDSSFKNRRLLKFAYRMLFCESLWHYLVG